MAPFFSFDFRLGLLFSMLDKRFEIRQIFLGKVSQYQFIPEAISRFGILDSQLLKGCSTG